MLLFPTPVAFRGAGPPRSETAPVTSKSLVHCPTRGKVELGARETQSRKVKDKTEGRQLPGRITMAKKTKKCIMVGRK